MAEGSEGRRPVLTRSDPPAPVRIVHLGLGAFHRAHQAVYTDRVDIRGEWGIAAFTGRRPDMARTLAAQGGRYTLIERSDAGDRFCVIDSVVEAVDGAELARLAELVAAPTTALITLTVTEAAYRIATDAADVDQLRAVVATGAAPAVLATMPARLVYALNARRRADGRPIAVVPCDNLADNGRVTREVVLAVATAVDAGLARWIEQNVSFVSTSVDRITPASTEQDIALVGAACGCLDRAPVVTEPFSDWVLSGDFPAGRPPWEQAGAQFVDDVAPYEKRKLWLLNGAHSLLAYLGQLRGFGTVAEAIADVECRARVNALWDLAETQLPEPGLQLPRYREQLLERFSNRSISHQLGQIAIDGSSKLANRLVPIVRACGRDLDLDRTPALIVLAAWMDYLVGRPAVTPQLDANAAALVPALAFDGAQQTRALLAILEPAWAHDDELIARVHELRQASTGRPSHQSPATESAATESPAAERKAL